MAVGFGLLEHFVQRERLLAAICETQRIAGRYGFAVPHRYGFVEPHYLLPFFALWPERLKAFVDRRKSAGYRRRVKWLSRREWEELFRDRNLRILDHWYGPVLLDYLILGGERLRPLEAARAEE